MTRRVTGIDPDHGSDDGIPWHVDANGVRWYAGECGGCGTRYRTQDWLDADRGACPVHGGGHGQGHEGDQDVMGGPNGSYYDPAVSDAAW